MATKQSQSRVASKVEELRLMLPDGVEVETTSGRGKPWSRDGEVLVTATDSDTLLRVHQAGYRVSEISGNSILVVPSN